MQVTPLASRVTSGVEMNLGRRTASWQEFAAACARLEVLDQTTCARSVCRVGSRVPPPRGDPVLQVPARRLSVVR